MSIKKHIFCWPVAIVAVMSSFSLQAASIDLNDFFADPTVSVAADGSSALLVEEPGFTEVSLANDPGLGDPQVIFPASGIGLFFDYAFVEAAGEDDRAFAFILDEATGNSLGPAFEFFTDVTSSGTAVWDLSGLTGTQPGLVFSLQSGPADSSFNSTLTISNVRLDTIAPVPAPVAIVNMLIGLGGLAACVRQQQSRTARSMA